MFFGHSYPSVNLEDIATKCIEHGLDAKPPSKPHQFDFVVVGGGTAGCVLAKRLSTSPSSILVLERGQFDDSFASRTPLLSLAYNRNDDGVLKYNSAPQRHLHDNRSMKMIGGKLLGGTSRVNNGLYTRCQPAEFQDWGEGWNSVKAEELYNRSEANSQLPSATGEWQTRIVEPFFESSKIFLDTIKGMGVPFKDETKDKRPASYITKLRTTVTADGKKSATNSFLSKTHVESKSNLKICLGAVVQRLDIDEDNQVQGVFVETEESSGTTFYVKAKEVILCGGAVASPQLLLLSGIGPSEELAKYNIACKVDLPGVGINLQDHISVPISYTVPIDSSLQVLQNRPLITIKSILQYLIFGTGMFLSPVAEYTYFLRSDRYPPHPLSEEESDASRTENLPDLEFAYVGSWGTAEEEMPKRDKSVGFNTILIQAINPKSKGSITLVDRDARTPPLVDPDYLSVEEDMEILRKGIEYGLDIGQKMMEKLDNMTPALVPKDSSSESVDGFIRKYATGAYHLCSTCRMANREDDGVVDQNLRVYGLHGLRIADASIFPRLIRVKPQATVVLVGEKCAEIVLSQMRSQ